AALSVIYLAATLGLRLPWGWVFVLVSAAGVVTPRGQIQVVGPALFTAAVVSLVLWLTNRDDTRRRPGGSAAVGPRERAAQLMMGLSGERQVGRALASDLPQDYVLINGLKLPRGAGDIDHLVVGPSGLFVLETKT